MRPWWDRNPAALDADIAELTEAGFRVRRQSTSNGGPLELFVEAEERRFLVRYRRRGTNDSDGLRRVAVIDGEATDSPRYAEGSRPLQAVRWLLDGDGDLILEAEPERVLVPSTWSGPATGGGRLELGRSPFDPRAYAVRGLAGSLIDPLLQLVAAPLLGGFPVPIPGLWAQGTIAVPSLKTAAEVVRSAERQLAAFHGLSLAAVRARLRTEVGAIVSGAVYTTWQFVRRGARGEPIVLQTVLVNPKGWTQRAPYATRLAGLSATIIGCGAVGWSVATQLARSGVTHFTLYDADHMDLGNLARVGAFLTSVGRTKVEALAEQLEATVPGVAARPNAYVVGIDVGAGALVADAPDLLINLSGETISTDETNVAALALEKPALFAWVSNGVAAGRIFRVRPYQSPCYHCVREAGLIPIPSDGPVPTDPELAWSGASFNVDAFAAAVARLAVLTLAGEPVSLRNPDHVVLGFGGVTPWEEQITVPRDRRCAICGTGRPTEFVEWR